MARKEVEGQLREAQSVCEALQRERDLAQTRVCARIFFASEVLQHGNYVLERGIV